jgi:hypothetical protein
VTHPTTTTSRWADPRFQAAIAYAVYGVVYLVGAVFELNDARMRVFWGGVPWWVFYVVGTIFLVGFPFLIWRGLRWLIWPLCVLTGFKAFWLCWIQGRRVHVGEAIDWYQVFFVLVAVGASVLLFRAGMAGKRS